MNLFTLENLRMDLGGREVLNIPALEIPDGQIVVLTGPNGSGKTTLLQILCGLIQPCRGKVLYRGQDLFGQSLSTLNSIRRDLGIVLQSPYLFKTTVLSNISYGLIRRGVNRSDAARKASEALDLVGLENFGSRSYLALSGGEAQRVALARALVLEPDVLLLDEPFANVDTVSRSVIERVLLQENRYSRTSVVFTTHDLEQACRLGDNVITLIDGIVQSGLMENLFRGTIRSTQQGAVFDTDNIKIAIPRGSAQALTASIPPESILVSLTPISSSARNVLNGRITSISEKNGTIDIVADVGETFVARITKDSYQDMKLMLGMEVYFIFKAEAVRLY